MITTVTLNPAVDRMLYVENLKEGLVNRVFKTETHAGGKGINVSKVLRLLGAEVTTSGILGGDTGRYIYLEVNKSGLNGNFVFIEDSTRVNTKIYDTGSIRTTDLNEPGPNLSKDEIEAVMNKICLLAGQSSVMVLSGSLPPGMQADTYKKLVEKARQAGCMTILDCDGLALSEGIRCGPSLIKPNIHELQKLLGRTLESREEIIQAASELVSRGIEIVVVSLGSSGAILVNQGQALYAPAIPVKVKGTVGAGDSMVAALAFAMESEWPEEKALSLAISASAACVEAGGTSLLTGEAVSRYLNEVKPISIPYRQTRSTL